MVNVLRRPLYCPVHSQQLPSFTTASAGAPPSPLLPQAPAGVVRSLPSAVQKVVVQLGPCIRALSCIELRCPLYPVLGCRARPELRL